MSYESIISILLSIPVSLICGIISGLYTGLIVTRYSRFSALRNEALRIIRVIDFIDEKEYINISNTDDVGKIFLIAMDLEFLGHEKAANKLYKISNEITSVNYEAGIGKINYSEYHEGFRLWQVNARSISPSKKVVFSLMWGNL
jgi:hypothetical protein